MKLLFDQNISYRITKHLPYLFQNSSHVKTEGLINASDYQIWKYARLNGFTIVTQDSDFNDLYLIRGYPPKIIWLKTGNINTDELVKILQEHSDNIKDFIENKDLGCFEIFRFVD
jgi:predicted nuclease of predicted toxin-antitoxin system